MGETAQAFDRFLQARLDGYIAETAGLCAQPSISTRGEGVAECADLVVRTLERHEFRAYKIETPGSPVVVGQASGRSERTLLLYNRHC